MSAETLTLPGGVLVVFIYFQWPFHPRSYISLILVGQEPMLHKSCAVEQGGGGIC